VPKRAQKAAQNQLPQLHLLPKPRLLLRLLKPHLRLLKPHLRLLLQTLLRRKQTLWTLLKPNQQNHLLNSDNSVIKKIDW
jgi:hypothetical protein